MVVWRVMGSVSLRVVGFRYVETRHSVGPLVVGV